MKRSLLALAFLVLFGLTAMAQKVITGTVTSSDDGSPLPGVNILEKGTTNGTVTDVSGKYSIQASEGAVLVFSYVGFAPQEITVSARSTVDVGLEAEATALSEIVVIGYGQVQKKDLTGAVTSISSKDFNKAVMTSPQDMLVGKIAGVQVVTNSGAPGAGSTIRVRGGSSLSASNTPLIVIDGFPVDNTNLSGMENPLASINPNDIESVTVLKDASATAIYGSRASNGVIIITTKKGREGKPQFSYQAQVGVSSPIKYLDVMSGDEFRDQVNQLYADGFSGLSAKGLTRLGSDNTDWQKEIYQSATSMDHNISVSGTTADIPYRLSYGYTDQEGILKTTNIKRHTINLNLNPSFMDDHLNVKLSVKEMLSNSNFGDRSAIGAAVNFDPTQPVRNGNTRWGGYYTWAILADTLADGSMNPNGDPNTFTSSNPVALLDLTNNTSNANRTVGNIELEYRLPFLPELRAVVNTGIDYQHGEGVNNIPAAAPWSTRNYTGNVGGLVDYTGDNKSELLEAYFNYLKDLGPGKLDLTGGYSWQHFKRENTSYDRNRDYNDTDSPAAYQLRDSAQNANENFLVSFFGRLNYSINDKYLLTATLRDDGSSKFLRENRWGLFPAVALAWRISDENFMSGVGAVSNLKLRLGYGVTGQQDVNNQYPALAIYTESNDAASYQLGSNYVHTLRPEPYDANIKWEETTTYNAGLDFGFMDNRISGSFEYYQRFTDDLLNTIPVPAGSNFSNFLTTNVGSMEIKGFEITLQAAPVVTSNFRWDFGLNLARNENEITKLTKTDDPTYEGVNVGGISGGVGNNIQIHTVGFPANSFYTFQQVYDANGMPVEGLYVDRTGEGGAVASNNLNKYHNHSPAPEWLMGVNSQLRYKNFDFSFSGRLSLGNFVYNNVRSGSTYASVYIQSGAYGNVQSSINETQFNNSQYWSDFYIEDGSFFKMDNMSLGYDFGNIVDKLQARVSFTVQNAFIITDYTGLDPELGNGIDNNIYPRPRTFTLGVNLTY